mgnify:CR=1 FL=1
MALKHDFATQVESQLAVWQAQIKEYQERAAEAGAQLGAQAKSDYEKGLAQLKASAEEAGRLLAQAKEASEGAWHDMQTASAKAFAQLQQGWADALKRFH